MKEIVYLGLALVCSALLCVFAPAYFTSQEDANHYFEMKFMGIQAEQYNAEGRLVADETFTYADTNESGEVLSTHTGATLMNTWALPLLAIVMMLLCAVDIVLGISASRVKQLFLQARLNIVTLIISLGYYAMLALYIFFVSARFDLDWHLAWPACLPLVVMILVFMAMRSISLNAKKLKKTLSGSIR
ncbi:MAG: DUF4293 domain-containing protein [Paludibacteraceae bacterium]|nr:DUF4293 domain-containing protein [Paludibacteraceae bacterium]